MHNLIAGSLKSYQDTIQNPKRRRPLCVEDWWLVHHQSKTNTSMNNLPNQLFSLHRSHLDRTPISKICRTVVSLWSLLYSWWNAHCLSNSFPWIPLIPMLQKWTFPISQNVFFFVFCNIHRKSFLSFLHLIIHSVQEWSWFHWQF